MNSAGQPAGSPIGLPPELFAAAFPFHLAMDRDLTLLQTGRALPRICPDAAPGAALTSIFRILRPEGEWSFQWLIENQNQLFLLVHLASGLQLRGQFVVMPGESVLLFLGSPWFTESSEIAERGLSFEDFAIHDPVVDLLQVFQAQKMALTDAKKLLSKLSAQRAELRAVNERLRHQEAEARKLALIAARTDNAVVLTDAQGRTMWVNDGFTRLTGYTLEEMLGKKPGRVLQGPGTDPETVRRISERLHNGQGFTEEILNYSKHGRSYWLAVEVQPIYAESGHLTNFMAIESDITERRMAQQRLTIQLEISRALALADNFATAVPQVLQAVCENLGWEVGQLWRVAGESLRFSEAWHSPAIRVPGFIGASRAIGFTKGVGLPGRIWAEARPAWIADVTRDPNFPRGTVAAEEGLRGAFGFPVFVRGELWGVVEFFSRRIEEPDEMLIKTFSAVGNQIGQFIVRREAEEALRETNTLQEAILEGANYSIISTAPNGVIQTFNTAAERMLGYTSEEVVGKATPALIHDPEEVRARADELTRELGRRIEPGFEAFVAKAALGQPDEREWTYLRKDGSRFPVLLSVTALFDEQDKVTGYLGIASDITESKRVASELYQAKEAAEAANRAKSDFLAMMSHEIRTPMNAVIGMTDLLLKSKLTSRQREFAEAVAESADGLLHVIDDVLDFSKIEAGKLAVASEEFAVRSVIDAVLEIVSHREPDKKVTLAGIIHHEIPVTLNGDALRLRQILLNLVGNAMKFTDRGEVVVRARPVARSGESLRLHFEVTDTGVGLTDEQIQRLFQPFVQADSSSSRRYGGTGLGLAISRRLVELMGGKIGARSSPQQGSTFWFELPFGMPPQLPPLHSHPGLVSVHAIVGTQQPSVRESLAELFSAWGVHSLAPDSVEAFTRVLTAGAGRDHVLVVVCDDELLEAGGASLRDQLLGLRDRAYALLLTSPHATVSHHDETLGLFKNVLLKPPKQSLLFDALMSAIGEEGPPRAHRQPGADRPKPDAPAKKAALVSNLRILLAEDHPINRKLGLLMLEGLGATADVANNGLEVLAALKNRPYDLILMDCNMPEMDGYQAATAIRQWESALPEGKQKRTKIVALTANALIGERERCLAAGMDDYLTKPFTSAQLQKVLSDVAPATRAQSKSYPGTEAILNPACLNQLCSELDAATVQTMVGDFLRELPGRLVELRQSAESGNWEETERGAHSLKGVSASFGFESLSARFYALEQTAQEGKAGTAEQRLAGLETQRKLAADAFGRWLENRLGPAADPGI